MPYPETCYLREIKSPPGALAPMVFLSWFLRRAATRNEPGLLPSDWRECSPLSRIRVKRGPRGSQE
jgi:hypothetical protein